MTDKQITDLKALYYAPTTLRGQYVTLVTLTLEHSVALFQALNGDEEIWNSSTFPVAQPHTLAEMQGWIVTALEDQQQRRRLPFAVVEHESGSVIGSTSYAHMSPPNRNLDVGWTWYAREYWQTAVNTECKFLLLRYAFETLRCIRVQFRVDARNLRSQRAVERIGGIKEGMLRKSQILYDGHERSVVLYSLLDNEWPARKAWFKQTLGRRE
jgi:N-acetyltransferase